MLADHAAAHHRRLRDAVCHGGGVPGPVECRADVVGHAAVDGDVAAAGAVGEERVLDHAHPVEGHGGGAHHGAPGLHGDPRDLDAQAVAGRAHSAGDGARRLDGGGGDRVDARVGDAHPAAQVDLGQRSAHTGPDLRGELADDAGGLLECGGALDLAANVAVQAAQLQVGAGRDGGHDLVELAVEGAHAELLVLVPGGDVLVAAGVHAGLDPDHDAGGGAQAGGDRLDLGDLVQGVDEDPLNALAVPGLQGGLDLGVELVVAVQAHRRRRGAGA